MVQGLTQAGWGYPGLWLACAGSGIFMPMPEDLPLMYAGIQISANTWSLPATLAVAWLGVVVRDLTAWAVGRYLFGWMLRTGWFEWIINQRRVHRAERLISRHGASAVLIGRFMIGFRVPFFVAAGAMGVPLRAFFVYDAVGLTIAVPLAVGLGLLFGEPILTGAAFLLNRSGLLFAGFATLLVSWFAIRRAIARRPEREPIYGDVPAVSDVDEDP